MEELKYRTEELEHRGKWGSTPTAGWMATTKGYLRGRIGIGKGDTGVEQVGYTIEHGADIKGKEKW